MSNQETQWGEEVTPVPASAPRANAPAESAAVEESDPQNDLLLAALTIFEDGRNTFKLKDGFEVNIYPATMKQMAPTMRFFHEVVASLETSQLAVLIDMVAKKQKEYMEKGVDPRKIDIQELVTADMVGESFGNVSILSLLFAAAFEYLPGIVKLYTNIDEKRFGDLEFDEGVTVVVGVFALNYGFFTQRLRPILMGSIRLLAKQSQKNGAAGVKQMLKTNLTR